MHAAAAAGHLSLWLPVTPCIPQRCNDLLEVCEAQLQFAPRTPLPAFGGTKGPDVRKSILDIQVGCKDLHSYLWVKGHRIQGLRALQRCDVHTDSDS